MSAAHFLPLPTARPVILESPYAGAVGRNLNYLHQAIRDCLLRGEAPFASHALYTLPGVLNDLDPEERTLGIHAGFSWRFVAGATVVYTDLGISDGMTQGIEHARSLGHAIEYRTLPGRW